MVVTPICRLGQMALVVIIVTHTVSSNSSAPKMKGKIPVQVKSIVTLSSPECVAAVKTRFTDVDYPALLCGSLDFFQVIYQALGCLDNDLHLLNVKFCKENNTDLEYEYRSNPTLLVSTSSITQGPAELHNSTESSEDGPVMKSSRTSETSNTRTTQITLTTSLTAQNTTDLLNTKDLETSELSYTSFTGSTNDPEITEPATTNAPEITEPATTNAPEITEPATTNAPDIKESTIKMSTEATAPNNTTKNVISTKTTNITQLVLDNMNCAIENLLSTEQCSKFIWINRRRIENLTTGCEFIQKYDLQTVNCSQGDIELLNQILCDNVTVPCPKMEQVLRKITKKLTKSCKTTVDSITEDILKDLQNFCEAGINDLVELCTGEERSNIAAIICPRANNNKETTDNKT